MHIQQAYEEDNSLLKNKRVILGGSHVEEGHPIKWSFATPLGSFLLHTTLQASSLPWLVPPSSLVKLPYGSLVYHGWYPPVH